MPTLRADRRGYALDEESVEGFADRDDLSRAARRKLAHWARRFTPDELSPAQRRLLSQPDEDRGPDIELLAAALRDAERDIPEAIARGFYDDLSAEQLAYVRDPARHPALADARYPLTMKQMEQLTGATGRQLRHWDSLGLLPSHRVSGRRRFVSAAVARAFALKESQQHEIAALATLSRGGPDAARLIRLVAAQAGSMASGLTGTVGAELGQAAATFVAHSRELAEAAGQRAPEADAGAGEVQVTRASEGGWRVIDPDSTAIVPFATKEQALRHARQRASSRGDERLRVQQGERVISQKVPESSVRTTRRARLR